MPRVLSLLPAALVAARGGMSANAFLRNLKEAGLAPRRAEGLELFKYAKGIVARTPEEPFRPVGQVPSGADLGIWPTRNATGVVQRVAILYRDRTTGKIQQTWWSTVSPNGITRERAMTMAIDAYSEHAESYDQDIIGAVHTSAYRQAPGVIAA